IVLRLEEMHDKEMRIPFHVGAAAKRLHGACPGDPRDVSEQAATVAFPRYLTGAVTHTSQRGPRSVHVGVRRPAALADRPSQRAAVVLIKPGALIFLRGGINSHLRILLPAS